MVRPGEYATDSRKARSSSCASGERVYERTEAKALAQRGGEELVGTLIFDKAAPGHCEPLCAPREIKSSGAFGSQGVHASLRKI